ncbi:sensor histidine kinase [Streptomyces sp. x-19]|uniref:sensor histidine kinase n=1 Tax=Streptomyces sp. x-19 TaxID=2789280 RepID=UPI00397F39AB
MALAAAVFGVGDSLVHVGSGLLTGRQHWAALAAALTGLLVLWRNRWPRAVTSLVLAAHVLCYAPGAVAVMVYTLGGMYRRPLPLLAVGLSALAAETTSSELAGTGVDLVYAVPFVAAPVLMGLHMATRQKLITTARERAEALEARQTLLQERARAEERTRIARELHDVVAHRVSHVVLVAGALQVSADRGANWVRQEAERIRSAGSQALTELRGILGVLTDDNGRAAEPSLEPTPTTADLATLVADGRHLGADITLRETGPLETLPTAAQVAVYRVVQEALTNVLKHAPGAPVSVDVASDGLAVRVEVTNGPPTRSPDAALPSGGYGLVGLAERLRVLGGTFTARPGADGGFRVLGTIPRNPGQPGATGPHAPPGAPLAQNPDR